MEIEFSKYQLQPANTLSKAPREGALLKVKHVNGNIGYADCHPWPELGDSPLKVQLHMLAAGKTTGLTEQSLKFASLDAKARNGKNNLFQNLETPKNHYLIMDHTLFSEDLLKNLFEEGFRVIKVKMGNDFDADCRLLRNFAEKLRFYQLQLRLDFNGKLNEKEFIKFLNECGRELDVVEFFEDPFPYGPNRWQEIQETQGVKLACDRLSRLAINYPDSCDFLVVKPAIQEVGQFIDSPDLGNRRLVLTSYLDHPIGQLAGLYAAAQVLKKHPDRLVECGFLSHHSYASTNFSRKFNQSGSRLVPSNEGFGFGYDQILEELKWTALS